MTIRLAIPQAIYEVGGRSQNEDYIYPTLGNATAKGRWYIVCDGVGGASKGEVASRLLAEGLNQYFSEYGPIGPVTEEYLQAALSATEQQMEAYITDHPEAEGMASTLTLLFFDEKGATIAWIGDSRVYQFRQGACIYQTQDHSLVNQLVQQGVLTEDQAKDHPRRNVILRAVKGSHEPAELEFHRIEEVQAKDVFLLCSDGLLEQWDTPDLATLTASGLSLANIRSTLLSKSQGQTSDNFSAYLVQVASVNGQKKARIGTTSPPLEAQQDRGWLGRAVWAALIVGLIVLGLLFVLSEDNEIRKQALAARMNGKQVEALFWADSLTTLQADDENKKMAKALRDSLHSELFLWMSDSTNPQYHISYYGCGLVAEDLQIWGDKRTTGTIFRLRQECTALSADLTVAPLLKEGDEWWEKERFTPALKLFQMAQKLDTTEQAQLRLQLLQQVKEGDVAHLSGNPGKALGHYRQASDYLEVVGMATHPLEKRFVLLGEASPFPAPSDSAATDSLPMDAAIVPPTEPEPDSTQDTTE